jgi:hypothetical protein
MWLAQTCRHLLLDDVIVDKLHFLTFFNNNIFYQMASVDFNMKKGGQFDRLAINQMRF